MSPEGMKPEEVVLWDLFRAKLGAEIRSVRFNVRVGEGTELPEELEEPYRGMATKLSQKRIDAVVEVDNETWIVELTERIGSRTLGQLMVYARLYREKETSSKRVKLIAVGRSLAPDLADSLTAQNIEVVLV